MDWKEFFKPIKGKLLIILIVVLLWPNYFAEFDSCIDFAQYNEVTAAQAGCHNVSIELPFWQLILFNITELTLASNFINFILSLAVSYLIACIVSFLWLKYRTKH